MIPHLYFLIDSASIEDSSRNTLLVGLLTRILVYYAALDPVAALTWNFEIFDSKTRPRNAPAKRKVGERKRLSLNMLGTLTKALDSVLAPKSTSSNTRDTKRSALNTIHERLMCLEADAEWGDPALMRSPSRRGQGGRGWTDPTRLNDHISVRSHIYILSQAPQSLGALDEFVLGNNVVDEDDGTTLLEKLTQLRDGLIGNGIWESYARKRVGVNWIDLNGTNRSLVDMDPVDILIEKTFGCCFEALGGCLMRMDEIMCADETVPFSFAFAAFHRTRTYPGWSRKFDREISAVVDRFSLDAALYMSDGDTQMSWSFSIPGTESSCLLEPQSPLTASDQGLSDDIWLKDSRLLQRYDLPEMVALAGQLKNECTSQQQQTTGSLVCVGDICLSEWPHVVCQLDSDVMPDVYHFSNSSSISMFKKRVFVARQQLDEGGKMSDLYKVLVPVAENSVAVYHLEAHVYGSEPFSKLMSMPLVDNVTVDTSSSEYFRAAWIEDWAWCNDIAGSKEYLLDIQPADECAIDVSFDESMLGCPASASSELPQPSPLIDTEGVLAATKEQEDIQQSKNTADTVLVDSLETWYTELYLPQLVEQSPRFSYILDILPTILPNQNGNEDIASLATSVLLSSSFIEEVFDNSKSAATPTISYHEKRLQAAQQVSDTGIVRRLWQYHECQLQILLYLYVLDRMKQDGSHGDIEEQLVEGLRDIVDLLCIWTSLDDTLMSSSKSTIAADNLDDTPEDLAAAFVGGPLTARFTTNLNELVDEIRVQCGWVPPKATHGPLTASKRQPEDQRLPAETKRRKGTPRKIDMTSDKRSEVIVGQRRHATPAAASGRKIARHLEELIGGARTTMSTANVKPLSFSSEKKSTSSSYSIGRRHSSQPKLPLHLIRQMKSEVVSTMKARPSLSTPKTLSKQQGSFPTQSAANSLSCKSPEGGSNLSRRKHPQRKRAPIPTYNDLSSSPIFRRSHTEGSRLRLDSSPVPDFLRSVAILPTNFACDEDDEDRDKHGSDVGASRRTLKF